MKNISISRSNLHLDRLMSVAKKELRLSFEPKRIECFDNSNIQGSFPVASCVVFVNGVPAKKEYRHFNIKTVVGADDFASMKEVVSRRYKRLLEKGGILPQLVIVDGGKGQLKLAGEALNELGLQDRIVVISIAKRLEEIYFPGDPLPMYLDKNSETLKLIQQLRDEAHRFGITFHRNKRSKAFIGSELDKIKGIGDKTRTLLFQEFKSMDNIKKRSFDELSSCVGKSKAKLVLDYFNLHS